MTRVAAIFYAGLLLVALLANALRGVALFPLRGNDALLPAVAFGLVLAAATIRFSAYAAERFPWAKSLETAFQRFLGPMRWWQVLGIALASSIAEEAFFRGALQVALSDWTGSAWLGLWLSSAVFAMLHVLRWEDRYLWEWTAFAFILGLAMGALFWWSESLLPPITLHVVVNAVNLRRIARGGALRVETPWHPT